MKVYLFIFIFFLSLFSIQSARAFSISPLKFSASVEAGENRDWEVVVTNNSVKDSIFVPLVIGLKQDDLGRSVFSQNIDVAENWFKTPLGEVKVAPGQSAALLFSVNVPINTPPGAHYLGLVVKEKNDLSLSAQLATILNLQIAGQAHEDLAMEKFLADKEIFINNNWTSIIQVRNTGNVGLEVVGRESLSYFGVKFSDKNFSFGNTLFAQSVRMSNLNLFPSEKIIPPGLYRAEIQLTYGLTNQIKNSSVTFWYLPVWFLVSAGLAVSLIVFFIFKKNKNASV